MPQRAPTRTHWRRGVVVAIAGVLLVALTTTGARERQPPQDSAEAAAAPQAMVDRYCLTCHNERVRAGGFVIAQLDLAHVSRDADAWETVVRKLRTGMMPPSGAPRPERSALDGLAGFVEQALDAHAAASPDPGATVLHRLNRSEYANAVRDLLDLPIDATLLLPGDDSSEGFDNMASVLSVSPALMQAYVSAAAKISRLAVGDSTISPGLTTYTAPRGLSQSSHREGLPLGTRGGLLVQHVFPLDAEYEIRIGRAGAGFGLAAVGGDEAVELTLNGERVHLVTRDTPSTIRLRIPAGPQTLGVAVIRSRNAQGVDDLYSELASSAGVSSLVINGPFDATGPGDTPSRQRIFSCRPAAPADELPCARQILAGLATRAFRRPVDPSDPAIDLLVPFYETGLELRGFDTGVQYALARILVDPQFIFRFEREPAGLVADEAYAVSDIELASRLSFFLWSSIPDDELLRVAAADDLSNPAVLEAQTRRMLADPRADALVDNLAGQWLLLRELDSVSPGDRDFDGNLRNAFRRETELLFETIVREDRPLLDLIDADYTFVDERLARHYGIPNIRGSRFRRVRLDDDRRRGLLGHGSLLTATSVGNRTSPVKRGKWILENLLGAPVPLPPPGVETNLDQTAPSSGGPTSLRQRLERHRAAPSCAACHAVMDPIGFSLENYDLTGRWRETDGGAPVNASGVLADGTRLDGPASLREALLDRRGAFTTTTTEKLLTYALGRKLEAFDMPAVRAVAGRVAAHDYRFSELVVGIVNSVPFRMKRAEGNTTP